MDAVEKDSGYAMFMSYISEMMPGGSSFFPEEKSIKELYYCTKDLFASVKQ